MSEDDVRISVPLHLFLRFQRFITLLFLPDWNCHLFVFPIYSIESGYIYFKHTRLNSLLFHSSVACLTFLFQFTTIFHLKSLIVSEIGVPLWTIIWQYPRGKFHFVLDTWLWLHKTKMTKMQFLVLFYFITRRLFYFTLVTTAFLENCKNCIENKNIIIVHNMILWKYFSFFLIHFHYGNIKNIEKYFLKTFNQVPWHPYPIHNYNQQLTPIADQNFTEPNSLNGSEFC